MDYGQRMEGQTFGGKEPARAANKYVHVVIYFSLSNKIYQRFSE